MQTINNIGANRVSKHHWKFTSNATCRVRTMRRERTPASVCTQTFNHPPTTVHSGIYSRRIYGLNFSLFCSRSFCHSLARWKYRDGLLRCEGPRFARLRSSACVCASLAQGNVGNSAASATATVFVCWLCGSASKPHILCTTRFNPVELIYAKSTRNINIPQHSSSGRLLLQSRNA